MQQLLEIEGSRGIDVPYLGYTEVNFQVPGVKALNEDILVVIQNDSAYSQWVPITLGTLHIDMVIEKATSEELQNLGKEWKTGVLGAKIEARQAKLEGKIPPIIDQVDHEIKLSRNVTIHPRKAIKSTRMVQLPVLSKQLNVTAEPMQNIDNFHGVHAVESYTTVKLGTKRVAVALVNNSGDKVVLKKGTKIGWLKAANVVPPSLAPCMSTDLNVLKYVQGTESQGDIPEYEKPSTNIEGHKLPPKPELSPDRLDKLFSKLDFSVMEEWPEDVQQQVVELFKGYHHIFALTDLKLGCTSKIKHEIKLDNEVPFKDHYRRIPPNQFKEVQKHLQDMLDIGAIRHSCSLWASAVVLV